MGVAIRKFIDHSQMRFWRQRGDCCLFFEVIEVLSDTGFTAELKVTWHKQLDKGWRKLVTENTKIREREYANWNTYYPRGYDLNEN